ncbi:MAG TPA: hypothetical protein VIF09_18215 [Polyangiaceae bacterium]|jgi:hypothetical protein
MAVDYAYPPQLARFLRHAWEEMPDAPVLMETPQLERVLTVAYQASLLRDEDRTIRVRIVVARPEEFDPHAGPPDGLQPLLFGESVPYTPEELRRLAVAAKYHRALVAVRPGEDGRFRIWGMVQSGPGWLQMAQGGRGPAPVPPPSSLLVRVLGPGRIAVGRGLSTLAELRGGVVGSPGMDVFRSQWLPARFAGTRAELATLHAEARARAEASGERWADLDREVIQLVSQAMVRRFLAAMASAHHGGTVIVLPTEGAEQIVGGAGPLRLKYAFDDGEPRRRYRRLILGLMRAIARAGGKAGVASVDRETYASLRGEELSSLRDAIFEMSQLIAALSEVDGAVVMTQRFEILGFGAEILGDLPDVHHVARALGLEAEDRVTEPLSADGTRHRSAYRLCSRVADALALVVSQDGGVRFVAKHDGEVTFWDHAVETLDG